MTLAGRTRTMTARSASRSPAACWSSHDHGIRTIFTVEPVGRQCRVSFDTLMEPAASQGLMLRLFARRLLRPLYADEQERLEAYARALATSVAA